MPREILDARPTLDGYVLTAAATRFDETARPIAHAQELVGGGTRRQTLYAGAGYPDQRVRYRWEIAWDRLRSSQTLVASLLARPIAHTWTMWRPVEICYSGDNVRTAFITPWQHAPFVEAELPAEDPGGVHLGWLASMSPTFSPLLTVVEKTASEYDGGSPVGEVWVDTEAPRFKIEAALTLGQVLYVSMVPQFSVVEVPSSQPQEIGRQRTPRHLILAEAG